MSELQCGNTECESRDEQYAAFAVNVVVDADRSVADRIETLDPKDFECCYCGNVAEAKEDECESRDEQYAAFTAFTHLWEDALK